MLFSFGKLREYMPPDDVIKGNPQILQLPAMAEIHLKGEAGIILCPNLGPIMGPQCPP